ncbi:MAG: 4Fe-4S binding protein [Proteobacteria bacterium]|nr:4Fe-4S binding protein [Pseudomonadota bacterium]
MARWRTWLARYGDWLAQHQRAVRAVQWVVVVVYAALLIVPAVMPLPGNDARALDNLTIFAQWAFWGFWWPFVILSMFVMGRTWCGVFCPEGTLTEVASKFGLHRGVPRWIRWGGWPFVAFAMTTVFGQLVSVYQYPKAVALVLGGSTLAAIVVGYVYGREKRVWCRYLCPVNGVFNVLSRVAPVAFRVDRAAWQHNAGHIAIHPVNCAPLVRIKRMTGPSECHMCGRCSGHLGAVELAARPPNREVATLPFAQASTWDAALIVFGLIGLALGAFQWNASPWFITLKLAAANFVLDHHGDWLLADNAPWWLLTHYPEANDVFTWLDGTLIVGYIVGTALVVGGAVSVALLAAARAYPRDRVAQALRLAYALIPLAGLGVFLGLSSLTVTLAKAEGLFTGFVPAARAAVLALGALWSLRLAWLQLADVRGPGARVTGLAAFAVAVAIVVGAWSLLFFRWG